MKRILRSLCTISSGCKMASPGGALIQFFFDRVLNRGAQIGVLDRPLLIVGDKEHVFYALAERGDFRVLQLNAKTIENSADAREQTWAVGRDHFQNGLMPAAI